MRSFAALFGAVLCLAVCPAVAQAPTEASPNLGGTSWRLVKFQSSDGTVLTPDDPNKYTIAFNPNGTPNIRLDCDRGRGAGKVTTSSQPQPDPLALTRAMCLPGSLRDGIVKHWGSYAIRDGHLFLLLAADGGSYEFEPLGAANPPPTAKSPPPSIDPTLVRIDSGMVRGVVVGDVISFKGIPYARPPVGALRWRVPQLPKPWRGVRDANAFGPSCMQPEIENVSEDCLTLNVWRPAALGPPFPVMVWIHGGALVRGGAPMYPADALARQGVVAVTIQYRLGRLGFFAHPALDEESPHDLYGNYGFMDQLAALEWVQRNAAAFGGDPKSVTLFGESAGGGSVLVHLTSPLSRGLFHRAVLQSPGMPAARAKTIPVSELAAAEEIAVDYARSEGVTGDGAAALEQLRSLPATRLIEGASGPEVLAALADGRLVPGMAMAILDGRQIVEPPESALAAGHQAMVPILVGANDRDLGLGIANSKDELFTLFGRHADEARRLYDPRGDQLLEELKVQVFADRMMVEPARHLADEMVRAGQPTWWYRFSYVAESQRGVAKGALHGMEIPYVFCIPAAHVGDKVTPDDKWMGDLASGYWVQFAKTGDPNGGGRPLWPPHDPTVDRVINFTNSGVIVGTDPLRARLDLWERVLSEGD
jgi:para-nitrobenzyl esterase